VLAVLDKGHQRVTGPASRRPAYLGRANSGSRKRPPKCYEKSPDIVPAFTYKLAREKQSVQQREREFIVVRAAGAMLTFGAKLRRVRVIRRVL
jgi:hypothetical protein